MNHIYRRCMHSSWPIYQTPRKERLAYWVRDLSLSLFRSLSLFLSLTHTHTHSFLFVSLALSFSLSLSHSYTHTHTHTQHQIPRIVADFEAGQARVCRDLCHNCPQSLQVTKMNRSWPIYIVRDTYTYSLWVIARVVVTYVTNSSNFASDRYTHRKWLT